MLVDGDHPHWWIDPTALPVADIGDFEIALGDIAEQSRADRGTGGGLRTSDRARRRTYDLAAAAACAGRRPRRAAGARSFRCACRYLVGQLRAGLRAWLGVLPRHRGRPDRPHPHRPDRHPLTGPEETFSTGRLTRASPSSPPRTCTNTARRRWRSASSHVDRRRARLSLLRYRLPRPGLRARHRHARNRRAGELAGAGDPAPARHARVQRNGRGRGRAGLRHSRDHRARGCDHGVGISRAGRKAARITGAAERPAGKGLFVEAGINPVGPVDP